MKDIYILKAEIAKTCPLLDFVYNNSSKHYKIIFYIFMIVEVIAEKIFNIFL